MAKSPIKVKFSNRYWAKIKRIQRLPKLKEANELMFSFTKRDALNMVKNFQTGIKSNAFGLEKLKDGTIKYKRLQGYELPEVPLYAKGDDEKKKSYVNMLRIRRIKNGYKVAPSIAKHWKASLQLIDLFRIHEFGTIIMRGETMIRIPSRPAFLMSFEKTIKERIKKEPAKVVKNTITDYINTGKTTRFLREIDRATKGLEQYEIQD